MFEKQIRKLVDVVGDENQAMNIVGGVTALIIIASVITLYFVWRPQRTPDLNNNLPLPGFEETNQ